MAAPKATKVWVERTGDKCRRYKVTRIEGKDVPSSVGLKDQFDTPGLETLKKMGGVEVIVTEGRKRK